MRTDVSPIDRVHHLARTAQVGPHGRMSRFGVPLHPPYHTRREQVEMVETSNLALGVLATLNAAKVTTASAREAALVLSILADGFGAVSMSSKELSCRMNCSTRTARRATEQLRASGILQVIRKGQGRRAARYYLSAGPITRGSEVDPCRR